MAGEENYGYTPPHQGPYAQYDTYIDQGSYDEKLSEFGRSQRPIVDKDGKSQDNEEDVDYAPLEKLVTMMGFESDELTRGMARLWGDISALLEFTRTNMKTHADALAEKWKSPAAESFLLHIGATLYSLDEWKKAADDNATGLYTVASQVEASSKEVQRIWTEYKQKFASTKADLEDSTVGDKIGGVFGVDDAEDLDDLKKRYANQVRPHVQKVASAYLEAVYYKLGAGTKYKGPLNAEVKFPGQVPGRPGAPARPGTPPTRPGGQRPVAPGRPDVPDQPDRPELPDRPDAPDRPDLPNRPDLPSGPELAGGTTAPTAPTAPSQISVPGSGGGGPSHTGPPPSSPVLPSAGGGGGRPGNPGLRAKGAPNRPATPQLPGSGRGAGGPRPGTPQLPGRGGQNAKSGAPGRGGAPSAPQLPGRGGKGARPGAPGRGGQGARPGAPAQGAPGAPKLPGRGAPGTRPGTPRVPGGAGQGPATPPKLAGRGASPVKPGSAPKPALGSPSGGRPGSVGEGIPDQPGAPGRSGAKGAPGLGGRRQPSTAGPGAEPPGARPGVSPALGGRAGTSPKDHDPQAGVHATPQRRQPRTDDDDLWAVDEAAPAVIESPVEENSGRQNPGPALGAGR